MLRCLFLLLGAEAYRAGTSVRASGRIKGKTAKKAVGAMLDTNIANMGSPLSAGSAPKGKGKGSGKGAAAKKQARPKIQNEKKDLEKDIKAFLGCYFFNDRISLA